MKRTAKRQTNVRRSRGQLDRALVPGSSRPSQPDQIVMRQWFQGPAVKYTSQASTGLISVAYTPSLSLLQKYSTIQSMWDQYRFTKIRFHLYPVGTNSGTTKFFIDDQDSTLPVLAAANSKMGLVLSNNSSSPNSVGRLTYRPQDLTDLQWQGTNTAGTFTSCALKIYTDLSTFITQPSTDLWVVTWEALIELRGLGGI